MFRKSVIVIKAFRKTWFDVLMLAAVIFMAYQAPNQVLPTEAKVGFFSLLFSKLVFINCGILVAHITRKLHWWYINFSEEKDPFKKLMVIAWYVVIIYCFARGG